MNSPRTNARLNIFGNIGIADYNEEGTESYLMESIPSLLIWSAHHLIMLTNMFLNFNPFLG